MIQVRCTNPGCGARFEASDAYAGGQTRCLVCGGVVQVPAGAPTAVAGGRRGLLLAAGSALLLSLLSAAAVSLWFRGEALRDRLEFEDRGRKAEAAAKTQAAEAQTQVAALRGRLAEAEKRISAAEKARAEAEGSAREERMEARELREAVSALEKEKETGARETAEKTLGIERAAEGWRQAFEKEKARREAAEAGLGEARDAARREKETEDQWLARLSRADGRRDPPPQAPAPAPNVDLKGLPLTDVEDLLRAYDRGEEEADREFRQRWVILIGEAQSLRQTEGGIPYAMLRPWNASEPYTGRNECRAYAASEARDAFAALVAGSQVFLAGRVRGRFQDTIAVLDCIPVAREAAVRELNRQAREKKGVD